MGGPTRPTPGVPFVSRRKEPKACRGCRPWTPLGGIIIPPQRRCRSPQKGFQPQQKTDLPLWIYGQIGPVFPLVSSREHFLFSIRGSAGGVASEDTANFILSQPIPLEHRAGGSKGATPRFAGGARDQEVPGVSLPTFSTRESRPGWRGGAPKRWQQGLPAGGCQQGLPAGAASRGCQQGLPAPQNPSRGRQGEKKRGS